MGAYRTDRPLPPSNRRHGTQPGDTGQVDRETGEIITRPWSENEVAAEMGRVEQALEDDIATLKALGSQKARAQSVLDRERARALLICKTDHKDMSSDALRQAWIIDQYRDAEGNAIVADLMLENDLASTLYWDQSATVKARQAQADILRSMLRSARDHTESWPENR